MVYLRVINQESPTGLEPVAKRPIGFKVKRLDLMANLTYNQRDNQNDMFPKSLFAVSVCVSVCQYVC